MAKLTSIAPSKSRLENRNSHSEVAIRKLRQGSPLERFPCVTSPGREPSREVPPNSRIRELSWWQSLGEELPTSINSKLEQLSEPTTLRFAEQNTQVWNEREPKEGGTGFTLPLLLIKRLLEVSFLSSSATITKGKILCLERKKRINNCQKSPK